jgi:hypothetical protein
MNLDLPSVGRTLFDKHTSLEQTLLPAPTQLPPEEPENI